MKKIYVSARAELLSIMDNDILTSSPNGDGLFRDFSELEFTEL